MNTVEFTATKRDALRKAYDKAVADKLDQFRFECNEYYVPYAGYLLVYLDNQFRRGSA